MEGGGCALFAYNWFTVISVVGYFDHILTLSRLVKKVKPWCRVSSKLTGIGHKEASHLHREDTQERNGRD